MSQNIVQDKGDSQNKCFNAVGRFYSQIVPCEFGLCTEGKIFGSLLGDYNFRGNRSIPTEEPTIPNVMFYTGYSRVFMLNGELDLTDAGALDMSTGNLSSLLTVTGGTGDYVDATGYLYVFGATDLQSGTASGKFEGMICR